MAELHPTRRTVILCYFKPWSADLLGRFQELVTSLIAEGHDVHCFAARDPGIPAADHFSLTLLRIPAKRLAGITFWTTFVVSFPLTLFRHARRIKAAALILFSPSFAILTKLSLLLAGVRLILFVECVPWETEQRLKRGRFRRGISYLRDSLGIFLADAAICPLHAVSRKLVAEFPTCFANTHVVPYGIKMAKAMETLSSGKRFSSVLKRIFHGEKVLRILTKDDFLSADHVLYLLRVLNAINSPSVYLTIFGDGPERRALQAVAEGYGLADRVSFVGSNSVFSELISKADMVVFPNPNFREIQSVLEALRWGIPVLAQQSEVAEELLPDVQLRFTTDDVGRTAFLLSRLLQSEQAYTELAQKTLEIAAHWQKPVWTKEIIEILEKLQQERSSTGPKKALG